MQQVKELLKIVFCSGQYVIDPIEQTLKDDSGKIVIDTLPRKPKRI
jgi:hypothetical protein